MRWFFLGLLFAMPVRAQVEIGREGWTDPYIYELAQLRMQRPSYFWSNVVIVAGTAVMIGSLLTFSEDPGGASTPR